MKKLAQLALAGALLAVPAAAQPTPPAAGRLHYDGTRRLDTEKIKITSVTVNGQQVNPEDLGTELELPQSIGAEKDLVFSGFYAKEERNLGLMMRKGANASQPAGYPHAVAAGRHDIGYRHQVPESG